MKLLLYQIKVIGRVQGVWFRKYSLEEARKLGINGFVRNEKDMNVFIEAEGTSQQLDLFVKWLHKGSPLSSVLSVEFKVAEPKYFKSFEISS